MRRFTSDLRAAWQFLTTGFRQIDKNASLFPSSRFLCRGMVRAAELSQAKCVVEFGPGTGAVTKEILRHLPPDAHLHAVELDEDLLETTTRHMNDPRLRPHHGSAADADVLVRESGCTMGADAVLSSLGLALMSDSLRTDILEAAQALMLPQARYVQYSYPHAKLLTYQFQQGWSRFDGRTFLLEHFRNVESRMVWLNAPPAALHVCRGALGKSAVTQLDDRRPHAAGHGRRRKAGGGRG